MPRGTWTRFGRACLAAGTIGVAGMAAAAEGDGPEVTCHESAGFEVVGRALADQVGTEFIARPRSAAAPAPCRFEPQAGDYRIGGSEPYHFEALTKQSLVLTASTGPAATLSVFDLARRTRVLAERLTEASETKVEGSRVTFTLRKGAATARDCRELAAFKKQGGSGEIGIPSSFDLDTGTLTRGTKTVCTYAQ